MHEALARLGVCRMIYRRGQTAQASNLRLLPQLLPAPYLPPHAPMAPPLSKQALPGDLTVSHRTSLCCLLTPRLALQHLHKGAPAITPEQHTPPHRPPLPSTAGCSSSVRLGLCGERARLVGGGAA